MLAPEDSEGDAYLWHDELAAKLGGWDAEGANNVAGARFMVLKARRNRATADAAPVAAVTSAGAALGALTVVASAVGAKARTRLIP